MKRNYNRKQRQIPPAGQRGPRQSRLTLIIAALEIDGVCQDFIN